jgi:hypothetical protein
MINGNKDTGLALFGGPAGGHVRSPHLVDALGGDLPVMDSGTVGMTNPVRGQKTVRSHQPQDPSLRAPHPLVSKPGPHLAISFPMKERGFQYALDLVHQLLVTTGTQRAPAPRGNLPCCTLPLPVDGRASNSPKFADSTQTVIPGGAGRNAAAYRLGLRRPKGRPSSMCPIFSLSSSLSMVIWPILASSRLMSSWRLSPGRPDLRPKKRSRFGDSFPA